MTPVPPAPARARAALAALLLLAAPLARAEVSFVEPRLLPDAVAAPGGAFHGAVAVDLDGDGALDVAATGRTVIAPGAGLREIVAVWVGNGDGTFQPPFLVDLGPDETVGVAGIVAADVDRDGAPDLVAAAWRQQAVRVLRGRGDGTFDPPATHAAGVQAGSLQAGDLDGDGFPDIAVAPAPVDPSVTAIAVLRGDGQGGLGLPALHAVARFPVDLVLADADADGDLDVLVACNSGYLSVLRNGAGVLPETGTPFPVRIDARGLWAGDFDADGTLDVLVGGLLGAYGNVCGGGCIVTVHGNGDGTFAAPPVENVRVTGPWPSRFYVAGSLAPDLNGDGRPDAFFTRAEGNLVFNAVTVMTSEPGGGYALSEWVASPGLPADAAARVDGVGTLSVAAGDLDGDGAPDLAVATAPGLGRGAVSVLPGLAGSPGAFRAPRVVSLSRGWSYTRGLALADLDGDAALDVLAVTDALDGVPGNGDGTFGAPFAALGRVAGPGELYDALRTADLDGDGIEDALWLATDGVQGGPPPRHLVAFGNGDGTFSRVVALPAVDAFGGRNAAVVDLDGDGDRDLAVLTIAIGGTVPYAVARLETWLNALGTGGTFALADVVEVQPVGAFVFSPGLAAADLDGDGRADLVAHRFDAAAGDDLVLFRGNGDGTLGAPTVVTSDLAAVVSDVAVADLDADGARDLVVAWGSHATVLLGSGDGTFAPRAPAADVVSGIATNQVRVADLDGDGRLDLVVGAANGPAWHRGDGAGRFGPPHHLAIGVEAGDFPFEVGDLDGDGLPDLVAGHPSGEPGVGPSFDYLTVLRNDSGPRADLAVSIRAWPEPVHAAEPLAWTVTVRNDGPDASGNVVVTDRLRLGASFASATPSQGTCARAGDLLSCGLGTLSPGASATVSVVVSPLAAGTLWHGASARGTTPDPRGENDAAAAAVSVIAALADLSIRVDDAPDPVAIGARLTYALVAANAGPSAATGVAVGARLPDGAALVSAAGPAGACPEAGGTVTCALGDLAPGAEAEATIVVTPSRAGALELQAYVTGGEPDPAPGDDAATARTNVEAPADDGGGGCGCGAAGGVGALPLGLLALLAAPLRRRGAATP